MLIYTVTNQINAKQYIGQTTQRVAKRWKDHQYDASYGSKSLLHKAIRKYGAENFEIEEIVEADNLEQLNAMEIEAIKIFMTLAPNGYNLDGGGKNKKLHADTKARISMAKTGKPSPMKGKKRKPLSEEHKQKIGDAHRGIPKGPSSLKGKKRPPFSDEWKENMGNAKLGKQGVWSNRTRPPFSEEWKTNIGLAHKGKPKSTEQRANMSISQKARRTKEKQEIK